MELFNSRSWTNEKHVKFLNSMEESFVRAMFEKKKKDHRRPPRLDRYLPDTSDSTLDLKTSSRISKNHHSSQGGKMGGRCHKRSMTISSQPSNASPDQVVPQIKIRTVDDKDEIKTKMYLGWHCLHLSTKNCDHPSIHGYD